MPIKPPAQLLRRFPLFSATNVEQFAHALETLYGARLVDLRSSVPFRAWARYLHLDEVALGFAACNVPATLDFLESDFVRQQFAIRGRAVTTLSGIDVNVDDEQACTASSGRTMRLHWNAHHERMTLRIRSSALEKKLGALLGFKPKAPLEFDAVLPLSDSRAQSLFFSFFVLQNFSKTKLHNLHRWFFANLNKLWSSAFFGQTAIRTACTSLHSHC